uniref:NADH-ubiquinone oxidoreductase chain 6 n=1 Tax=Coquillettidia linealis TaxID=1806174 RepID=A0A7T0CPC0_9DIPT|nr:NADH dehydrogenase subunit 6 [Coquillettidia linealis]QPJ78445.1 NADH dehydrogenase subunit 6 [Coquillettidia linealis]
MLLLMTFLCLMISLIFMQMKHPLAMGLILLIQTFFTCLLTGLFMKTFWFSYILFLIFMGGMLVLFIYVTSLSSNEIFSLSLKLTLSITLMILLFSTILLMSDKMMTIFPHINQEMTSINIVNSLFNENMISLNKLYNFPTNLITILLINYLFLTLLVAVKITKKNYGPLRPMN